MKKEIKIAHIYGHIATEQELTDALEAVVQGKLEKGKEVVAFLDYPLPWLPDGTVVVLPGGQRVRLCVVNEWPTAPLARPYFHWATALAAGRDALLAGATPEDAADAAVYRLRCATGDASVADDRQLWEDLASDMTGWLFALLDEPAAA